MAIYNLTVEPSNGHSSLEKYLYNAREGKYSVGERGEELVYKENFNLPTFAKDNASFFWECAENYTSKLENSYRKIEFSLPHELSVEENIEIAKRLGEKLFKDEYVYSLSIHNKRNTENTLDNIHCHIMFNEKVLDGIERSEEFFFKRYNHISPERGGSRKIEKWRQFEGLYEIRQTWEKVCNEKLKEKGIELVDCRSLKARRIEALQNGDYLKADFLDREPININGKLLRKDRETLTLDEKQEVERFELAIKVAKLKEKEYRIKIKNYAEENAKAKEEFLTKVREEFGITSEEVVQTSDFVVENKLETPKEIFDNAVEMEALKVNLTKKLNKIDYNSQPDKLREIVMQQLTNGEYAKKFDRYNQLKDFKELVYEKNFKEHEEEFESLNTYLRTFETSYMQDKILAKERYIREKYMERRKEIVEELHLLRNNSYQLKYIDDVTPNELFLYIKEIQSNLKDLFVQKEVIDKQIEEQKTIANPEQIKLDLCQKLSQNKYLEIKELAVEYEARYFKTKEELERKKLDPNSYEYRVNMNVLKEYEKDYRKYKGTIDRFEIKHNIKELVEEAIKEPREKLKELRQKQDDIHGRIKLNSDKLKIMKEYRKELNNEFWEIKALKDKLETSNNPLDKFKNSVAILVAKDKLISQKDKIEFSTEALEEKAKDLLSKGQWKKINDRLEEIDETINQEFLSQQDKLLIEKTELIKKLNDLNTDDFKEKVKIKVEELLEENSNKSKEIDKLLNIVNSVELDLTSPKNLSPDKKEEFVADIRKNITDLFGLKHDLAEKIKIKEKECDIKEIKKEILNQHTNGVYSKLCEEKEEAIPRIEGLRKINQHDHATSMETRLKHINEKLRNFEKEYIIPSETIMLRLEKPQKELTELKDQEKNVKDKLKVLLKQYSLLKEMEGFEMTRRNETSTFMSILNRLKKSKGNSQGAGGYFHAKVIRDDEDRDRD
ncbi:MAG: MobA/MobL family protein [Cetobacterium sp.]|uniref:MobA/MobL family protein n=1 Tax=Cetobacterium sp. TaxID=2071632 RepID=UPI003EE64354